MMNISDLLSRSAYYDFMQKVKSKEPAEHIRKVKVADGNIEFELDGSIVDDDLARKVWNGENYVCGYDITCNRTNNQGGCGAPISRSELLKLTYEQFVERVERSGKNFFPKSYTFFRNFNEQLSMFDAFDRKD